MGPWLHVVGIGDGTVWLEAEKCTVEYGILV